MRRTTRTVIAVILIELLLGGIWLYLAGVGAAQPDRVTDDFQATLESTMATVMGAFLGLGFVLYLMAAKRERG